MLILNKLKNFSISFEKIILIYSIYICTFYNRPLFNKLHNYFQSSSTHSEIFEYFFFFKVYIVLIFILSIFFIIFGVRYFLRLLIFLLLLSSCIIYYFKQTYGIIVDQDIIESFFDAIKEKNIIEIKDLLNIKLFKAILLTVIIPFIPLFFIQIEYSSLIKEYIKRISLIIGMILFLIIMIAINYKDTSLTVRENRGANQEAIPHYSINSLFHIIKASVTKAPKFSILDNNPILLNPEEEIIGIIVVGETARADRMSLNGYNKKTNPLLEQQNIINYFEAYSCGTLTKTSVPCMFFLDDYDKFSETKAKYQQNTLDIINKAGGDVLWIENNSSCKGVCNHGTKRIDIITEAENTYDEVLVKITEEIILGQNTNIQDSVNNIKKYIDFSREQNKENYVNFIKKPKKRKLIVLHIMGSHGPKYFKRYPSKFELFKPSCKKNTPQDCSQEELSNSYDNTILYTDYILNELIEILKKQNKNSFLIYASDHGESLGEFGLYLHGVPISIAPKVQTHIPWLMWYSEKYKNNNNLTFKNQKEKITHEFFPHTILKSLKIKTTKLKEQKSLVRLN